MSPMDHVGYLEDLAQDLPTSVYHLPRYLSIAHDARGVNLTYVVPLPTIRKTRPHRPRIPSRM